MAFPWSVLVQGINDTNNFALGVANTILAAKQQQKQNEFNEENLAMSREALAAQKQQQALENEWYIDQRDYQRALQQTIFDREDTAMQRARDDFVAAGFSPLAAVGNMAGAGQVVASASSPGNMVSNNQASTQVSNFVGDSLNNMANRLDSAAGRAMTELLASKQMAHDEDMVEIAHDNAVELKVYDMKLAFIQSLTNASTQKKLQELIGQQNLDAIEKQGENALALQNDMQEWQDSQPKTRSIDQIAEQFFNWLQKEDPIIAEMTDGYQGWEIGFKVTKEILGNMMSSAKGAIDSFNETMDGFSQSLNSIGEKINPMNWFK